jgi:hypothetical protein
VISQLQEQQLSIEQRLLSVAVQQQTLHRQPSLPRAFSAVRCVHKPLTRRNSASYVRALAWGLVQTTARGPGGTAWSEVANGTGQPVSGTTSPWPSTGTATAYGVGWAA